jgi:hypothetical protein
MLKFLKALLAILIIGIAVIGILLDLMSFSPDFGQMHTSLYGPIHAWRPLILAVRAVSLLGLGPILVLALYAKNRLLKIYLPVAFGIMAVVMCTFLNYLESKYRWRAYVVPQIQITKIQKEFTGPNEFVRTRICNGSIYGLQNLYLRTSTSSLKEPLVSPVLTEDGSDSKIINPGECYSLNVYVPKNSQIEDVKISYNHIGDPL